MIQPKNLEEAKEYVELKLRELDINPQEMNPGLVPSLVKDVVGRARHFKYVTGVYSGMHDEVKTAYEEFMVVASQLEKQQSSRGLDDLLGLK